MEKAKVIQARPPKPQIKMFQGDIEKLEKDINDFIDANWDDNSPINHIGWTSAADGSIHTAMIIYRPNE